VLDKVNKALTTALARDEVKKQLLEQGVYADPLTIDASADRLKAEIALWDKVIKDGNITTR